MSVFNFANYEICGYSVALRKKFRGITSREGLLIKGREGWGEFSPFLEYLRPEIDNWARAAMEASDLGWPAAIRQEIPVNSTIPAIPASAAADLALAAKCTSIKIKVGEPGQDLAQDLDRVAAVRAAVGAKAKIRIDVNGAWTVSQALDHIKRLAKYDLEYVEQPCASVYELAELRLELARQRIAVLVAADEAIRKAEDPFLVKKLAAADIAVLKVQPLGGVRKALEIAAEIALPVVVSSALESSVGLRAGLALAASLPDLPFACGLATAQLLLQDVTTNPLLPQNGVIRLRDITPVGQQWEMPPARQDYWLSRLSGIFKE